VPRTSLQIGSMFEINPNEGELDTLHNDKQLLWKGIPVGSVLSVLAHGPQLYQGGNYFEYFYFHLLLYYIFTLSFYLFYFILCILASFIHILYLFSFYSSPLFSHYVF